MSIATTTSIATRSTTTGIRTSVTTAVTAIAGTAMAGATVSGSTIRITAKEWVTAIPQLNKNTVAALASKARNRGRISVGEPTKDESKFRAKARETSVT